MLTETFGGDVGWAAWPWHGHWVFSSWLGCGRLFLIFSCHCHRPLPVFWSCSKHTLPKVFSCSHTRTLLFPCGLCTHSVSLLPCRITSALHIPMQGGCQPGAPNGSEVWEHWDTADTWRNGRHPRRTRGCLQACVDTAPWLRHQRSPWRRWHV